MTDAPDIRQRPRLTRAGEGRPRRAFSVDDVFKMIDVGVIAPDEKFELIEGEILPMSPEKMRHLRLRAKLTRAFNLALDSGLIVVPDGTLRLSEDTFLEPDIYVLRAEDAVDGPLGQAVLLCVEVSDSSLSYDRGPKAAIYARHGVRELWVVDAQTLEAHVYRDPAEGAYRDMQTHAAPSTLTALLVPGLALQLDKL